MINYSLWYTRYTNQPRKKALMPNTFMAQGSQPSVNTGEAARGKALDLLDSMDPVDALTIIPVVSDLFEVAGLSPIDISCKITGTVGIRKEFDRAVTIEADVLENAVIDEIGKEYLTSSIDQDIDDIAVEGIRSKLVDITGEVTACATLTMTVYLNGKDTEAAKDVAGSSFLEAFRNYAQVKGVAGWDIVPDTCMVESVEVSYT